MIPEELYVYSETFHVIKPLILTSRLFGLFPITYERFGRHYRLKWSVPYAIYTYLLSLTLVFFTLSGMARDANREAENSLRMTNRKAKFVTCCDISIVILIVCFGLMTLPFKVRKFWNLMNCLNQADKTLPIKIPRGYKLSSIYFLVIVIFTFVTLFSLDIASWFYKVNKNITYLSDYSTFYFLYAIVIMKEVFFWHMIFLIKIKLSLLNNKLSDIKEKATSTNIDFMGLRANLNMIESESKCESSKNSAKELIALLRFHKNIIEAVGILNNSIEYGIHILMLSCLLHLIVTPYFLLIEILSIKTSPLAIALQALWILAHIGRVLIIVEPCQLCINEHEKTLNILCDLLTSDFDEEAKKVITLFSLQHSYCKLAFSSCGYFKINRSLLTSIAGAVTTYLVILFQLNNN